MDRLRVPFFVVALALIAVAVLVELSSPLLVKTTQVGPDALFRTYQRLASDPENDPDDDIEPCDPPPAVCEQFEEFKDLNERGKPPGMGIPYMAFVDGLLLFTVALMGAALILPERIHGKVQGVATLIASILLIIGIFILGIIAFIKLMIMIALLTSPPFGTLAYFAIYGFFNRGASTATLSILMLLKLLFCGALVLAHQRFLQNKGLVLLTLTSLVANIIVGFLHGLVPLFLVSITDAVAAIVVAIIAIIWGIVFLVGSIVSVVKVLRVDRMLAH